ncbi:hypothetical protein AMTRI_Chr13g91200 [Amborella trichopoda]|uniref:Glycosyltransferase n=1 Tax=Amborella trichopoda TaxID=13333 RepID=W1PS80_AMBTC|nr:scopoletin glucosyltransferase [Amborella trichopoda]ERN10110.1 hypothetical protein AMTR_s00169p00018080 [Amborella trichopoda]|eukprot:XP_006848529.1 scopoletin glucosyltransferase [Amborella trichopoda]
MVMEGEGESEQSHNVVLFPFMAQGHMIPVLDIARMLADHGLAVTLVTTPLNAVWIRPILDRAASSSCRVRVLDIEFPCAEVGLPEGCESMDLLPSNDLKINFLRATELLQEPFEKLIRQEVENPLCIISDMFLGWTVETAKVLGIPRIVFHGTSCFSCCCSSCIHEKKPHINVGSDTEPFMLPGLPHDIRLTRAQLAEFSKGNSELMAAGFSRVLEEMRRANAHSYGSIVNSFEELESEYVNHYRNVVGMKAWPIGPVSLCNRDQIDKAERGKKASVDESACLRWLDSQKPESVVYVCFGSLCRLAPQQLTDIGLGLEASGLPFIWVLRGDREQVDQWLPEGFEERVKGRGMVIKGWAPQILILSHPATGGFVTHCGWNSTLEGLTAGLPMVAWPLNAEQPMNAKLVVDVLKVAVPIVFDTQGVVPKEAVEQAVSEMMGNGEMRGRARELGEMARRAVEEGGSSYMNLTLFIQDMIAYKKARTMDTAPVCDSPPPCTSSE